jgi:SAM-dependent MidA family methyltransferase
MNASFHIVSNAVFTNFPVERYIENNENLADRTSTDNDRLWESVRVFEYLKNI